MLPIQVQKAVMEPDVFEEDVARKVSEEEWETDSREVDGERKIDHGAFHKALFELGEPDRLQPWCLTLGRVLRLTVLCLVADIWTPEICADSYAAFLWRL